MGRTYSSVSALTVSGAGLRVTIDDRPIFLNPNIEQLRLGTKFLTRWCDDNVRLALRLTYRWLIPGADTRLVPIRFDRERYDTTV